MAIVMVLEALYPYDIGYLKLQFFMSFSMFFAISSPVLIATT